MKRIENPAFGNKFQPNTQLDYRWLNSVQGELCALVEASGQQLNHASNHQVDQALRDLVFKPLDSVHLPILDLSGNLARIANFRMDRNQAKSYRFKIYVDLGLNFEKLPTLPDTSKKRIFDSLVPCLYVPISIDHAEKANDMFSIADRILLKKEGLGSHFFQKNGKLKILNSELRGTIESSSFFLSKKSEEIIQAVQIIAHKYISKYQPVFEVSALFLEEQNEWKLSFVTPAVDFSELSEVLHDLNWNQLLMAPILLSLDHKTGNLFYRFNRMLYGDVLRASFGIFDFEPVAVETHAAKPLIVTNIEPPLHSVTLEFKTTKDDLDNNSDLHIELRRVSDDAIVGTADLPGKKRNQSHEEWRDPSTHSLKVTLNDLARSVTHKDDLFVFIAMTADGKDDWMFCLKVICEFFSDNDNKYEVFSEFPEFKLQSEDSKTKYSPFYLRGF